MNKLSLLLPALIALAGCAPTPTTQQPSVDVVSVTNKLTLTLSGKTLSAQEKADISDFIARRGTLSNLMVKIENTTQKGESQSEKVRLRLIESGLYPSQISVSDTAAQGKGDITIFVESYRAKVTACDAGKTPRTTLNAYRTQRNFGCANANALAQMVANPKDLIVGQPIDSAQGQKAVSSIDNYFAPPAQNQQTNSGSSNTTLGGSQ
ncbi:CpaD family pilus assembly lipoprotein [Vibrio splendidus]|jgi:pilus assembly protein CpaD|uniref:CpaD family pilus assembly lipoprotein n=1 Tax=Vibrio splendidus TaxID=29497 RepID=UPI000066E90F|nr:CpaD family pilus assembly lipoprotein [Vibrio splendidus]EAP95182.1 putative lipoprotein [Vibrio splendidus 12B01]MBU2909084.1 CpaD family pilus assembly protein [Vibrio splendidus]MDO6529055.1 CpaD family pilus assembly lipoprotein [Vibrio splendidus]MDO6550324.1 CpaD family pilus assembly lipoprotein [Vibrio splendidus]PHX08329.1 Pilus biogenesis CpaD protein [Vibrio splendidus]